MRGRTWRTALATLALVAAGGILATCSSNNSTSPPSGGDITEINHVVVIYMENHSFDNLYGEFAGANGLAEAGTAPKQLNQSGTAYTALPQKPSSPYPSNLPNAPFYIGDYVPVNDPTPDMVHRFYQEQSQINGGAMNKFVVVSDALGAVMGYYHTSGLPVASLAARYTLCDNFFHSAFGGSFLNHQWLIAAASPTFPNAPASIVAVLDQSGHMVTDGIVTPDGYAVNTAYSVNAPHPTGTSPQELVPNQTNPTIGDRLDGKGVTWAWYAGGWDNALAGHPDPLFQFHHQPFVYYANYADGTAAKAQHLLDESKFISAAQAGTLPSVSFVKPLGLDDEHPGYANILTGEQHVLQLVNAVKNGPNWKDVAIIITYDENGGSWDHVAPPTGDRWGPGTRVPTIIISPFAKTGFVDHTQYETLSILGFIEKRWGLEALGSRDAAANPLTNAFQF